MIVNNCVLKAFYDWQYNNIVFDTIFLEKKETVYSNANKQYLIFQPPAVLTLHLKRFEQVI